MVTGAVNLTVMKRWPQLSRVELETAIDDIVAALRSIQGASTPEQIARFAKFKEVAAQDDFVKALTYFFGDSTPVIIGTTNQILDAYSKLEGAQGSKIISALTRLKSHRVLLSAISLIV